MPKNITLLLLGLLCLPPLYAQTTTAEIAEAEMKSALGVTSTNNTNNADTGNYDMTHAILEFTVDPAQQYVNGSITTQYTAKEDMATITFDFDDAMTVNSVTQNGNNLSFTQNANDELVITLPEVQPEGIEATLTVNYEGAPSQEQQAFMTGEHNGTPVLWTLSEPYGAKDWWPCKQDLNDKIDAVDIYITAPSQYVSVANGVQQSVTDNGDGTSTTYFHHGHPIPAYLIGIAVTNYTIYTQTAGTAPNTFPIVNYFYPENAAAHEEAAQVLVPVMDFYEQLFEPYPFADEKYGQAEAGLSGGMEHTTVSFMNYFDRNIMAHELAHHWFGDKVTCGSWKDIWLNEGFATYLSGLVVEHFDGNEAFTEWKANYNNTVTSQPDGHIYLTDTDTLNSDRIFNSRLTYYKAALVLNMLRFKMGDDTFFQGIRNYLDDPALAFAYAKTPQFQAHMETASGMDLTEFFNDWIYNEGYPIYNITVSNAVFGQAVVTVNQLQSDPSVSFFEMPLPVRFYSSSGSYIDTVLDNTFNGQQFTVDVPFTVASVAFDPNHDIISKDSNVVLGLPDNDIMKSVLLYPNPSSGRLNLQLPQGMVPEKTVFYNALGQKEMETAKQASWDVTSLPAGVHFVSVTTPEGTKQLKFVKE